MDILITTSWDDGHPLDLRLAELLHKYDVPATFYIPVSEKCPTCDKSMLLKRGKPYCPDCDKPKKKKK